RYPLELAGWKVAPTAELNMLSYHIKGREEHSDYALNIKSQTLYSVESGLGMAANKDIKLGKEAKLSFNTGIGLYHEFGDPYGLKLGVEGMDGSFRLQNEHGRDRAVIRSGFDYNWQDLNIYGKISSYIDHEYSTAADIGLKWKF
ncbi:MAG: autotransporter domain-containing protein, partial [Alphaproteobacteria bacterium]